MGGASGATEGGVGRVRGGRWGDELASYISEQLHFRAGGHWQGSMQSGAKGEDVVLLAIAVIIFGVWMSTHHDGCRKSLTMPVIGLGAIEEDE
ncbi:hypothetical protein JHK82_047951 [Glycine max]|nr:hypothetical protein JHK82_047951 [Glycine max]